MECLRFPSAPKCPCVPKCPRFPSVPKCPPFQSAPRSPRLQSAPKCPIEPLLSPRKFFWGGSRAPAGEAGAGAGASGGGLAMAARAPCSTMATRAPRSAVGPGKGCRPGGHLSPVVSLSLEASRAPTPLPTGCCMARGRAFQRGAYCQGSQFLSPPSSVTSSDTHQIPVTIIANHLSSDSPHLSSAINSPHKSHLLPVPRRPVYHSHT